MSDMVEVVAKALWDEQRSDDVVGHKDPAWPPPWPSTAERYRKIARAAIAAMTGWQPIETAPKDGTRVLICEDNGVVEIASHDKDGWFDDEYMPCEPVAWMPLPAPPEPQP